jgi:hypothetical protein
LLAWKKPPGNIRAGFGGTIVHNLDLRAPFFETEIASTALRRVFPLVKIFRRRFGSDFAGENYPNCAVHLPFPGAEKHDRSDRDTFSGVGKHGQSLQATFPGAKKHGRSFGAHFQEPKKTDEVFGRHFRKPKNTDKDSGRHFRESENLPDNVRRLFRKPENHPKHSQCL